MPASPPTCSTIALPRWPLALAWALLLPATASAAEWAVSAGNGNYRYELKNQRFVAGGGFQVMTGDLVIFRLSTLEAEPYYALPVAECEEDQGLLDKIFGSKETKTFDTGSNRKPLVYSRIAVELFFQPRSGGKSTRLRLELTHGEDLTFVAPSDGTIGGGEPIDFSAARAKRDQELRGICGSGFNVTSGPTIGLDTTDGGLSIPYLICSSGTSARRSAECAIP